MYTLYIVSAFLRVCVCVCVFIKLHITAQSGLVILVILCVQLTSSRVRLGQSFKTVGYGSASCWGDLGAGSVEADVFYIPFIVSVQYIV